MYENGTQNNENNLREQYRQLQENARKQLELFWEQPSVIVAISAALLVAAYYYISNQMVLASVEYQFVRAFLIMFAVLMSFTSILTAVKHRFFAAIYLEEIKQIERQLKLNPVQMWTRNAIHPRGKNHAWEKWSADNWLIFALSFLAIGLLGLAAYNVYEILLRLY